eukprot:TRINITY_DN767_c0_g1_i1.p1 TRINITY_DN767_c0_g1~~TRINITY_DN767_c0_g1_i1.p1  ORF type:complete len:1052 (+),score=197.99 TRINITY_DN767_c0_g1_i1:414-3569(+)
MKRFLMVLRLFVDRCQARQEHGNEMRFCKLFELVMSTKMNKSVNRNSLVLFKHLPCRILCRNHKVNQTEIKFHLSHSCFEGAVEKFFCFDYDRDRSQCRFIDANAWDSNSAAPGTVSLREFLEEDHTQPRFSESTVRWIHLSGRNPGTIITLGNKYGLHPLTLEDILSHDERPRLDESKIPNKTLKKHQSTSSATSRRKTVSVGHTSSTDGSHSVSVTNSQPSSTGPSPPTSSLSSTSSTPSSTSPSSTPPSTSPPTFSSTSASPGSSPSPTTPSSGHSTSTSPSSESPVYPAPAISTAALAAAVAFLESRSGAKNTKQTRFDEDTEGSFDRGLLLSSTEIRGADEKTGKRLRWGVASVQSGKVEKRRDSEGNLRTRVVSASGLSTRDKSTKDPADNSQDQQTTTTSSSWVPADKTEMEKNVSKAREAKETEQRLVSILKTSNDQAEKKLKPTSSDPSSRGSYKDLVTALLPTTQAPSINSVSSEISMTQTDAKTSTRSIRKNILPEVAISPSSPSPLIQKQKRQLIVDATHLSPRSFSTSLSDVSRLHVSSFSASRTASLHRPSNASTTPTTSNSRASHRHSTSVDFTSVTHLIIPVLSARGPNQPPSPPTFFPRVTTPRTNLGSGFTPTPAPTPAPTPTSTSTTSSSSAGESLSINPITPRSTPVSPDTSQKNMIPLSGLSLPTSLGTSLLSSLTLTLSLSRPSRPSPPESPSMTSITPTSQSSHSNIPLAFYSVPQQFSLYSDIERSESANSNRTTSNWGSKDNSDLAEKAARISRKSLSTRGKGPLFRRTGGLAFLMKKIPEPQISQNNSKLQLFSQQLNIVLIDDRTVLTFQKKDNSLVIPLMSRIAYSGSKLRMNNARFLVYSIIDKVVDGLFPILGEYQKELRRLQAEIHSEKATELSTALQVQHINREMNYAILWLKPMEGLVSEMPEHFKSSGPDFERHLLDLKDHVLTLMDQAQTLLTWSQSLNEEYLNEQQYRMNQVMYVLALVTAVFIPGTVLNTIFGMNFVYMPPLNYHWGALSFWILFFLSSSGVVFYFVKRGWIVW